MSQDVVDAAITDYVITSLQPFATVERPEFLKMIHTLCPGRTVLTRRSVVNKLECMYQEMEMALTLKLEKIDYVCTAIDCWTARNR